MGRKAVWMKWKEGNGFKEVSIEGGLGLGAHVERLQQLLQGLLQRPARGRVRGGPTMMDQGFPARSSARTVTGPFRRGASSARPAARAWRPPGSPLVAARPSQVPFGVPQAGTPQAFYGARRRRSARRSSRLSGVRRRPGAPAGGRARVPGLQPASSPGARLRREPRRRSSGRRTAPRWRSCAASGRSTRRPGAVSDRVGRRWIEAAFNAVRLSDKQLPSVYANAVLAARILGMPVMPDVYVSGDRMWDSATYGSEQSAFVILGSALLTNYQGADQLFVIAREMGHCRAGHALWKTVIRFLLGEQGPRRGLGGAGVLAALNPALLVEGALELPLLAWARQAEITADRAGLLAIGDEEIARRVLLSWSLRSVMLYRQINIDAWLEQMDDSDEQTTRLSEVASSSTPYITRRLKLLAEYASSPGAQALPVDHRPAPAVGACGPRRAGRCAVAGPAAGRRRRAPRPGRSGRATTCAWRAPRARRPCGSRAPCSWAGTRSTCAARIPRAAR